MTITKKDYLDLKPYWDFQRKKEYNKEMINCMADKFQGRVYNDFGLFPFLHFVCMKHLLYDPGQMHLTEPLYDTAFQLQFQ